MDSWKQFLSLAFQNIYSNVSARSLRLSLRPLVLYCVIRSWIYWLCNAPGPRPVAVISFLLLGFPLSPFSSLSSISIYGLEVLLSVRKIAKATTTSAAAACLRSAVVVPRSALGVVINHSLSTTSHIVYLGSSVCFLCSCFFSSSLYFASSLSLLFLAKGVAVHRARV